MAAVAGDDHDFCTGCANLVHFFSPMVNSLCMISCTECAPAATAAELILSIRVEFHPVLMALIHDVSGLLIIPVTEPFFRLTAVIARIMIRCQTVESSPIQLYSAFFYVFDDEIEDGKGAECSICFRVPLLKTQPGR